jgi:hypothetical protein
MFVRKDYRESNAAGLMSYISREEHRLENRNGNEMTGEQQEAFIEKSENHRYEEQWIVSPENGDDLSNDELALAARRTMTEHLSGRPTGDFCYAVHRDTDNPHVQLAVTGEKADLWTEQEDLDRFKELAVEHSKEQRQSHEQQLEAELVEEHDLVQAQQQDRGLGF